jgi:hypothetical protein
LADSHRLLNLAGYQAVLAKEADTALNGGRLDTLDDPYLHLARVMSRSQVEASKALASTHLQAARGVPLHAQAPSGQRLIGWPRRCRTSRP